MKQLDRAIGEPLKWLRPDVISMTERVARSGHIGSILWLTGLSDAGRSTLAFELERPLFSLGYSTVVLDWDELRRSLSSDLGVSKEDRSQGVRRLAARAHLFAAIGTIAIVSLISPSAEGRAKARGNASVPFRELFVRATSGGCSRRNPKGFDARVAFGAIQRFTEIASPYEPPECQDPIIDACAAPVTECANHLFDFVCNAVPIRLASPNTRPSKVFVSSPKNQCSFYLAHPAPAQRYTKLSLIHI